nr:hypothetical protein [uncultured Flavobacterium sp.]
MKLFKTLAVLLFIISSTVSFSQSAEKTNCSILKNCKLKYFEIDDNSTYIILKGNTHFEYPGGGKDYIKSNLEWVTDCEYNATIIELTIEGAPFKIGDKLNVKFDKIDNGIVYYTANFKGDTFTGKFKIVN